MQGSPRDGLASEVHGPRDRAGARGIRSASPTRPAAVQTSDSGSSLRRRSTVPGDIDANQRARKFERGRRAAGPSASRQARASAGRCRPSAAGLAGPRPRALRRAGASVAVCSESAGSRRAASVKAERDAVASPARARRHPTPTQTATAHDAAGPPDVAERPGRERPPGHVLLAAFRRAGPSDVAWARLTQRATSLDCRSRRVTERAYQQLRTDARARAQPKSATGEAAEQSCELLGAVRYSAAAPTAPDEARCPRNQDGEHEPDRGTSWSSGAPARIKRHEAAAATSLAASCVEKLGVAHGERLYDLRRRELGRRRDKAGI